MRLAGGHGQPGHLQLDGHDAVEPPPLAEAVPEPHGGTLPPEPDSPQLSLIR